MLQGRLGQEGVAVLSSFALVDSDHHPLTINIGDLQACGFTGPQSRGVGEHQDGLVLEILGHRKEGLHLRKIQNDRQFPLGPGMP